MPTLKDYASQQTAWCPHCGNFGILQAVKLALVQQGLEPWEVVLVSGIGQAAKLPHYLKCNYFNGLHGRAVPVATGIKAANSALPVLVTSGDGDLYGEGGNHLLHAMRRNPDITLVCHNNQVYGLTKGQASPTSEESFVTKAQPNGAHDERFNAVALGILLQVPFVARGFARDLEQLADLIAQGMATRGLALIDVLQECVTFNRLNNDEWYRQRVYYLGEDYDATDRAGALVKAEEWEERIPLGIIYRCQREVWGDNLPAMQAGPLVARQRQPREVERLLEEFV
ncbi:MAG: 2-oxoacid ferredoxin oxidoreductase [candidate division WS1 bacterium]|nr:2-oxoacid ferredoxin oxidoreductase [candidate division WS1 bacterium]